MRGPIQVGNQLHVIAKSIIRQFLILGRRESIRLDHSGRATKLEVTFQLQSEAVDLKECSLAHGALQLGQAFQVMRIVPINMPQV